MVILVQCAKSSQQKWLKFSQDAYLAKTIRFSKYGVGLVSGPKIFFGGGVLQATYKIKKMCSNFLNK